MGSERMNTEFLKIILNPKEHSEIWDDRCGEKCYRKKIVRV
jgi:hypothetical protein